MSNTSNKIIRLFCQTGDSEDSTAALITLDKTTSMHKSVIAQQVADVSPETQALIIVLDGSGLSKLQKVIALINRRHTVQVCCEEMSRSGFINTSQHALFPNLHDPFLAYQTNSAAATYAENYLLIDRQTLAKKILYGLLQRLNIVCPRIDTIAIVGKRM